MSSVTLTNISKVYPNGHRAVDDFSLSIADGEFVVFVGPSGCGKSTTLRLIAGLEEDFSGEIRIGDRVVNNVAPKDRDIAMVFQNYALYPHMSAYTNMALALQLRRVPKDQIDQRVRAAAKMLEIEHLLERKPGQLSGGQRQRVALGRAIVREPAAFLFDEPLSNLDAKLRVSTRAELKALHARLRTTSIYVTHDQEEAMTLGDRIVVMHSGRILQAAPPLEVYRKPANRFVAGFVGMPPMNFVEGRLVIAPAGDAHAGVRIEQGESGVLTSISLPGSCAQTLAAYRDKPLVAGFRPQALSLTPSIGASAIEAQVLAAEPLGEQTDIHFTTASGAKLIARVASVEARSGQHLTLWLAPSSVHVFEPGELGRNLSI